MLVPDVLGLELGLVLGLVDLLEDILEAPIILLEDGVLCAEVERPALLQRKLKRAVGKVPDALKRQRPNARSKARKLCPFRVKKVVKRSVIPSGFFASNNSTKIISFDPKCSFVLTQREKAESTAAIAVYCNAKMSQQANQYTGNAVPL